MLVREIMSAPIVTVPAEASVREATARMLEDDIGSVLVAPEDDPEDALDATPTGILTETDALTAACRTDEPLSKLPVTDAASRPLVTTDPQRTVKHALETMIEQRITHLVVADDLDLVGMVTLTDVAVHHDEIRDEAITYAEETLSGSVQ